MDTSNIVVPNEPLHPTSAARRFSWVHCLTSDRRGTISEVILNELLAHATRMLHDLADVAISTVHGADSHYAARQT
jgi:hypothetical protein